MLIEHLFFALALAVIMGMILSARRTGDPRPYTLIIVACTFLPDIPLILSTGLTWAGLPPSYYLLRSMAAFHTLAALSLVSLLIGLFLGFFGFRFVYVVLCVALSYGFHLLGDALTHTSQYILLWPLWGEHVGFRIFVPYQPDILGIAETRVLVAGVLLLAIACSFRTLLEGPEWLTGRQVPCSSPKE